MTLLFATLSVHKLIGSVGSYIGFASLIAVAILILLYFAHARETNALRERLEEAQQHIGGLEARIAQLLRAPGVAVRRAPAPGPVGQFPGSSVRRLPNAATAAGAASAGPPAPVGPAGSGAPALASATRFVPPAATAAAPRPAAPGPAAPGPAAPGPAAPGPGAARLTPAASSGLGATAAAVAAKAAATATPGAGVNGRNADAGSAGPPTIPPWVRRDAAPAGARPPAGGVAPVAAGATAAVPGVGTPGGERTVRRIGAGERAAPSFSLLDDDRDRGRRPGGQLLPLLVAGVAIVVIIAGLIVIKSSTTKAAAPVSHASGGGQTGAAADTKRAHTVPFNAAHVTVAVMNGTAQAGLAADVGAKLAGDGYRQGNITNAASQTELLTYVYYLKGRQTAANEVAARHVAAALGLSRKRVRPAGSVVLQSCAISAAGAPLGACRANVVVSLGQDRVSLASGAATG